MPSLFSLIPRTASVIVLSAALTAFAACKQANITPSDNAPGAPAQDNASANDCSALPNSNQLKKLLNQAPDSGDAGGMFHGRTEWGAVVNRSGRVCVIVAATDSAGSRWPGSRNIARAKAFTANGFSTDTLPLSTARLYTLTQPGHSLWGVAQPVTFNPACNSVTSDEAVCGGAIAFGGGVPLYKNGHIVGGLGVSGDTPCADHEIAKRVRHLAGLDPARGMLVDDIVYTKADGPSVFAHPLCPNTWRNGQKIGEEAPATGY